MAKIQVLGDAVVLTSAHTLENLRTIAKYRPDALVLKGGEDGKEPVFAISVDGRTDGVNKFGATFNAASRDGKKLAQITTFIGNAENLKEVIADKYGAALVRLNKLEATLPAVLEEVRAERDAVMQSITIVSDCECVADGE